MDDPVFAVLGIFAPFNKRYAPRKEMEIAQWQVKDLMKGQDDKRKEQPPDPCQGFYCPAF